MSPGSEVMNTRKFMEKPTFILSVGVDSAWWNKHGFDTESTKNGQERTQVYLEIIVLWILTWS